MGFFEDHMLRLYPSLFHIPITLAILVVSVSLYRLYFHPLAHIPGPPFACVSSLFLYAICYLGVEGRVLLYYHEKYCVSVLRIAPDAVSLSGDDTLHQVYVAGGGLPKDARYQNFRVEGHDTIFSALDQDYRNERAKAVLPLFAPSRIQNAYDSDGVTASLVRKFIARLQEERASPNSKVDILDLSSRLSIDFLTAYLFHQPYGGLDEPTQHQTSSPKAPSPPLKWANKLSATPFVLSIVSFSRFSLLPNWAFNAIFSSLVARVLSNDEVSTSMRTVSRYADAVLGADEDGQGGEAAKRADSTAVMLATILFHLVRRPEARARLRAEIAENETAGGDPQALPYLRAVVREGLRLGMANPARLTRIVPPRGAGLTVGGQFLPPGTKVGAAAYVFHHNRSVFPQPFAFQPERWLPSPEDSPSDVEARRVREQTAFPFGLGSRACLGRNLASFQLHVAVKEVVANGVLEGSRTCADRIELIEWFNAEIKGHELEIQWN
ncbi:cytochrome P450 [Apiospora kogelbergensis]|uniref:cytochrome P450 n=1 Tax=Apiospora kogelbergensis TaxID=1337665 RepID=UPI00312FE0BF